LAFPCPKKYATISACSTLFAQLLLHGFTTFYYPKPTFFYIFNMAATEKGGVAVPPPSGALSKLVCLAQTFAVRIVLLAMK